MDFKNIIALKKQKSVGFFLLRMNPLKLIKCTDLALHITAAGMTSGGLRVQNFQNTIQNERRK